MGLLLVGIIALAGCTQDEPTPPPTSTPIPPATPAPTSTTATGPTSTSVPPRSDATNISVVGNVSKEFILPRENYDVSRNVSELVKPHFFATSTDGVLVEPEGDPDLVLELNGKVKIRL